MAEILLEVCIDSADGLKAAIAGGADRIELCSALAVGGLTPSAGLMVLAAEFDLPVMALIRPRAGDFVFSAAELDIMKSDIDAAQVAGLSGVVLGASLPDGRLDEASLRRLVGQAEGLDLTLHRCFDLVPDVTEAVELAVDLGFRRILTSGRARRAVDGIADLREAFSAAANRLVIMPGSGINQTNILQLLDACPFAEIHASCSRPAGPIEAQLVSLGFAPADMRMTDVEAVRALKAQMNSAPEYMSRNSIH